jgi:hypothetical protein
MINYFKGSTRREKIVFANCYGFFEGMVFLALKMEQLQEGCQNILGIS